MPKGVYDHSKTKHARGYKFEDISKMCGRHPKSEFKKDDKRLLGNKNAENHTPWNKGTHGLMVAWNKGKFGIFMGKDNPNWKGGSSENYRIRRTSQYEQWRKAVFERDEFTCQVCGNIECYITAHHLKSVAKFSELALDIKNGKTLCEPCHTQTDNYKGRARRI